MDHEVAIDAGGAGIVGTGLTVEGRADLAAIGAVQEIADKAGAAGVGISASRAGVRAVPA